MREITVIDILKQKERHLLASLSTPSTYHSYSLCVEYMKNWFLSKFEDKEFFKTVYLDGRNMFDDFTRFNNTEKLKREKPALAIVPTIDLDFDDNFVDMYSAGPDIFIKRSKWEDAFFKDKSNNAFLGLFFDTLLVNYNFKIQLSTRAQQIDLYKKMKLHYRVGATQGEYIDMDFHVPYSMILQLAKDVGFEIKDNKVVKDRDFLNYLNSHSQFPFLYKFRAVNGKKEYFIRLKELYVHIAVPTMSYDEGEREGQTRTNFMIELQAAVRFPAPKFYIYYSDNDHTFIQEYKDKEDEDIGNGALYKITLPDIPKVNSDGWDYCLDTEYILDDINSPLIINFFDLFEDGTDIRKVIDYNLSISLSPRMVIDIKLYNNGKEITNYDINWETLVLTYNEPVEAENTLIVIYTNNKYINELNIEWEQMEKSRLK